MNERQAQPSHFLTQAPQLCCQVRVVTPVSQVRKPRAVRELAHDPTASRPPRSLASPNPKVRSDRFWSAAVSWWGPSGERSGVFVFEGESPTHSKALMGSAAGTDIAGNPHG